MKQQPDILVFMSDQHNAHVAGFAGNSVVETPNLDRIAASGAVCRAAYTPCPLCVPARTSFVTGQGPCRTGVFGNVTPFSSEQPTFLHRMGAAGYETVLVGRMHFVGADQRHGFARRVFPDMSPSYHKGYADLYRELELGGKLLPLHANPGSMNVVGGGKGVLLEYDRRCVQAALDYLALPHDKPQCIVVGTCGPHSPYIATPEWYRHYEGRVSLPPSWPEQRVVEHPILAEYVNAESTYRPGWQEEEVPVDGELFEAIITAYYGLVSFQDELVGRVREAWGDYLARTSREGLFCYTSDHGDMVGEHGLLAKRYLLDGSAAIPMVWEGDGIAPGTEIKGAVSLMDIGSTLCDLAGAIAPPDQDGCSILPALHGGTDDTERAVFSDYIFKGMPKRMVRQGRWKLIHYHGRDDGDLLFDLEADPYEMNSLAAAEPGVTARLRQLLLKDWDPEELLKRQAQVELEDKRRMEQEQEQDLEDPDRWPVPPGTCKLPLEVGPQGKGCSTDETDRKRFGVGGG